MPGSEFEFSEDDVSGVKLPQASSTAKKRKAAPPTATTDEAPGKAKKRRAKPKSKATENEDLDEEHSIDLKIGRMDGPLLSDLWARQIRRFEPNIDLITLEDRRLPASAFVDTSAWPQRRNLENLPAFVERYSGAKRQELATASKNKGSPHTLVVAAAGLRAADLTRALRVFQAKDATVAKMFAKHIKLEDAIKFTKDHRINFAVGTPARIADILDSTGTLSLKSLRRIIVDASWINVKKRSILDLPETMPALSRLLSRPEIKSRYESPERVEEKISLLLF